MSPKICERKIAGSQFYCFSAENKTFLLITTFDI